MNTEYISKEQFDDIYKVIKLIVEVSGKRAYSQGDFKFETKWEYRKHEYVFGVIMKYEHANTKFEDYTCVMFTDGDEGVSSEEFKNMADEIEKFFDSVAKINPNAVLRKKVEMLDDAKSDI